MHAVQSPLIIVSVFVLIAWNLSELGGLHAYDQQRILQLYCVGAITASLLISRAARAAALERLSATSRPFLSLAGAVLFVGLISAASAELPKWSLVEWAVMVQLSLLALAVAGCRVARPASADAMLTFSMTVSAAAYASLLLTEYFFALRTSQAIDLQAIHPHFSNPRIAGQMFSVAIPLLLAFSVTGRAYRVVAFTAASILLGFSLSQGTRGTWLALLVAFAFVVFVRPIGLKRYLRVSLAAMPSAAFIYLLTARWLPAIFEGQVASGLSRAQSIETLTSDSNRFALWEPAARSALENPWLGIGPMHFAATSNAHAASPHSSLLQILAEWGIPAAILCAFLVGALVWSFARASREPVAGNTDNLGVLRCGVLAALVATLTQSMVDGVLVAPTSQVMLFLVLGWAWGLLPTIAPTAAKSPSKAALPLLLFAAIATATPLLAIAAHASRAPEDLRSYYCGYLYPRFWVSGRIGPDDFPARPDSCGP